MTYNTQLIDPWNHEVSKEFMHQTVKHVNKLRKNNESKEVEPFLAFDA